MNGTQKDREVQTNRKTKRCEDFLPRKPEEVRPTTTNTKKHIIAEYELIYYCNNSTQSRPAQYVYVSARVRVFRILFRTVL